jgi:hypothetical protein
MMAHRPGIEARIDAAEKDLETRGYDVRHGPASRGKEVVFCGAKRLKPAHDLSSIRKGKQGRKTSLEKGR